MLPGAGAQAEGLRTGLLVILPAVLLVAHQAVGPRSPIYRIQAREDSPGANGLDEHAGESAVFAFAGVEAPATDGGVDVSRATRGLPTTCPVFDGHGRSLSEAPA